MKRALVTGAGGFIGRSLVAQLKSAGFYVVSMGSSMASDAHKHLHITLPLVLTDVVHYIEHIDPTVVIHLACASPWASSDEHIRVTQNFSLDFLHAAILAAPDAKILTIGSAAEYGAAAHHTRPMCEEDDCVPISPYGKAKYAVTKAVEQWWHDKKNITVLRLFTAAGPYTPVHLALGNIAQQIQSLDDDGGKILFNMQNTERDYLDVRDVARLILAAIETKQRLPALINLASGRLFKVSEIIDKMIELSEKPCTLVNTSVSDQGNLVQKIYGSVDLMHTLGLYPNVLTVEEIARRTLNLNLNSAVECRA